MIGKKSKQQIKKATELINDLGDQDIQKRIKAAKSVSYIANSLGADRTIKQFIPFLKEQIINDQTSVVLALLDEVEAIAKMLGSGIPSTNLFSLLQDLIQNEEQKIRKKVINSYNKAIEKYHIVIKIAQIKKSQNQIVTSLKKILSLQYSQAKQAFAYVVSRQLGNFCLPNQTQFLNIYLSMCESESLPQRKFAAMNSSSLIQWMACNEALILKIVQLLFKDKQQSNKIFLVDTIIQLAKVRPPTSLQPYFNLISYQFTWRVRYQLISKIDLLANAMGKQNFKSFLTYIVKYINDIEPQIRSISCIKIQQLVNFVDSEDIIGRIIPALRNLSQDSHVYVKTSLSSSILYLCKPIGKKNTTDLILPKFLQLLKDQDQHVRLQIFKNVDKICQVLGVDTLSQTTMPVLNQLVTDLKWRVRVQSIQLFAYFIENSPKQFMDQKNIKLSIDYIRDRAFSVRKEGIKLLTRILKHFQSQWFQKNYMPKLLNIFKATSYLQRQIILLATQSLSPYLSIDYVNRNVYSNVKQLVNDQVQNVRLSSLVTLKSLAKILPKQKQNIKKMLKKAEKQDSDKDVRQMAQKMLKQIETI